VIHSWAVPAFWIKLDAVPGKLNETSFIIEKPGVYFGQCSELCGARHGYMPIAVEVVSPAQFAQWIAFEGRHHAGRQATAARRRRRRGRATRPAGHRQHHRRSGDHQSGRNREPRGRRQRGQLRP
jgi:cytochrome c oxidase subunit 2